MWVMIALINKWKVLPWSVMNCYSRDKLTSVSLILFTANCKTLPPIHKCQNGVFYIDWLVRVGGPFIAHQTHTKSLTFPLQLTELPKDLWWRSCCKLHTKPCGRSVVLIHEGWYNTRLTETISWRSPGPSDSSGPACGWCGGFEPCHVRQRPGAELSFWLMDPSLPLSEQLSEGQHARSSLRAGSSVCATEWCVAWWSGEKRRVEKISLEQQFSLILDLLVWPWHEPFIRTSDCI